MENRKELIVEFYRENHRMPSYEEVRDIFGFASKNTAYRLVSSLIDEGYLSKDQKGKLLPGFTFRRLKVLGLIEAGFPTPAEETDLDTISLDDFLIESKDSSYMLKVKGDSMIEAGINEGDYVIAERVSNAKVGSIVIAELDGGYTMKYLRKDKKNKFYLEPANSAMKNIYPEEDLKIVAVVRSVVRKY